MDSTPTNSFQFFPELEKNTIFTRELPGMVVPSPQVGILDSRGMVNSTELLAGQEPVFGEFFLGVKLAFLSFLIHLHIRGVHCGLLRQVQKGKRKTV